MDNQRSKTCKICGLATRFANTSWCYKCYQEREAKKKAGKKLETPKTNKHKVKCYNDLRRILYTNTWKLMSEKIRRGAADFKGYAYCYTCGKQFQWKELDAGHMFHDKLDFDERNIKPQCIRCNRFNCGHPEEYQHNLIRDNGEEWFNKLRKDVINFKAYTFEEIKKHNDRLKKDLKEMI